MSNLKTHALNEFRAAGWTDDAGKFDDEMQAAICDHVLKLLEVFADEGPSGSSAPYAVNLFKQLAMFEPIAPLTGEDWEWTKIGDSCYQNKRCSHIFKDAARFDGQAYDIQGIVFYDWCTHADGVKSKAYYTCSDSHVPITFPYTPKTEYEERL